MVNGGRVDFWACVNFSRWHSDLQHRFCEELVTMCNAKGMVRLHLSSDIAFVILIIGYLTNLDILPGFST